MSLRMNALALRARLIWGALAIAAAGGFATGQAEPERITLSYGEDPSVKILMKGRGGNLELQSSEAIGEGYVLTDYQDGSGYVEFDRPRQALTWRAKMRYTLNRVSKHIMRVAPYMKAFVPKGAALDFTLDINSLGYGSLDFADLNVTRFKLDVNYGDVDVSFPTENRRIVRGVAKFHVMAGDLEINRLANLKAAKVRVNGGVGELSVNFGPKLLQDMEVRIDHDIGQMDLAIPKGTRVTVTGTNRDLSKFALQKVGSEWRTLSYHEDSPMLYLRLTGPVGALDIVWE